VAKVVVRSRFSPRVRPRISFKGTEVITKQSHKDECDINVIVRRAHRAGEWPPNQKKPSYGDFSAVPDFQEAMNLVLRAEEQFASLPAAVRDRFSNDPARFLAFANDPNSAEEMIRLGLATARPPITSPGASAPDKAPPSGGKRSLKGPGGGTPPAGAAPAGGGPDA